MATGKKYYWMKLKESFMTSDTVDYFMSQPDGANYVVLYQMLCLKTINTDGRLERTIGEIIIPYDIEKIQRDCKWFSIDTVRIALELYKSVGLIYIENNGTLVLANYGELVGSETDWKEQKRAQRQKNMPKLEGCKRLNSSTLMLPTGKHQYVDEKRYGGNGMKAFDLAEGRCEMCGSYEDLVIHHGNGYSNDIEDLYILCRSCHGTAHAPSTPKEWLQHSRKPIAPEDEQGCGQEGGHVHTEIEIRDKRLEIDNINNNINNKENNIPEGGAPTAEEPVLTMTLNTGVEYPFYQDWIDEMQELYPAVDVIQELRKMKAWCANNPKKRKTKSGIKTFVNGWLSREQDKGGLNVTRTNTADGKDSSGAKQKEWYQRNLYSN